MKKEEFSKILASIAASYTRRELDRSFYDRLIASEIGQKLGKLSSGQKYALEFAAYAASAVTLQQSGDSGAVMKFLTEVAADAPSEIARRMINGKPKFTSDQLLSVVHELSDSDMHEIAVMSSDPAIADQQNRVSKSASTEPSRNSTLSELADRINASSARIRKRRKQR